MVRSPWWGPKSWQVSLWDKRWEDRHGEDHMRMQVCKHKRCIATRNWKEEWKNCPLEPLERPQYCQLLNFVLLISISKRIKLLSHWICDNLLRQAAWGNEYKYAIVFLYSFMPWLLTKLDTFSYVYWTWGVLHLWSVYSFAYFI